MASSPGCTRSSRLRELHGGYPGERLPLWLGSREQVRAEVDDLGLSAEGKTYLLERLGG